MLDVTASSFGWIIDTTPQDDSDFASSAAGMDLLTVLMHEYGHLLGVHHEEAAQGLMDQTLAEGTRELPTLDLLNLLDKKYRLVEVQ